VLALIVLGRPGIAAAQEPPAGVVELREGRFLLDAGATPPDDADPRWQPVSLPYYWRDRRPEAEGYGWYRFELPPLRPGADRYGLYLGELEQTGAVYLNREWLGRCGRVDPPTSHCRNRPLYFAFPASRLAGAGNVVHVRLYGRAHSWARLVRAAVGPDASLEPFYRSDFSRRIEVSEAGTLLGLALTVFIGVLWLGRRRESVYGWLALASLLRSINNLDYHMIDAPVSYWTWQHVAHAALDGFGIAGILTLYRMLDVRRPGLERVFALQAGLVVVVPLLAPRASFETVVLALHGATVALLGVAIGLLIGELRARRRWELRILLAAALGAFAVSLHDLLAQARVINVAGFRLLPYTVPLILLAFSGILLARFLREYERAERLNVELEARVREKHAELEREFERARRLEAERVVAGERERLMREVHDGIGGQLVSTLAMVESGQAERGEVAAALRSALDEMRIVVQSLDPLVEDLPSLLAILRSRLEPRLLPHGLRFEWRVQDLPAMPELGHDGFLHVLRIVQEAITNVVKHAGARVITVSTGRRAGADGRPGVFIEVRDDGVGPRNGKGGRGLQNMRQRARELGGHVAVGAAAPGTTVVLWIPLGSATPRA
jgi:signal transduction histidine kinase